MSLFYTKIFHIIKYNVFIQICRYYIEHLSVMHNKETKAQP